MPEAGSETEQRAAKTASDRTDTRTTKNTIYINLCRLYTNRMRIYIKIIYYDLISYIFLGLLRHLQGKLVICSKLVIFVTTWVCNFYAVLKQRVCFNVELKMLKFFLKMAQLAPKHVREKVVHVFYCICVFCFCIRDVIY